MTTSALGLSLTWPGRVLLAECDPAGRRVLSGFMAERLRRPPGPGLLGLAMALQNTPDAKDELEEYTLPLTESGDARLLYGIHDPRHARQLAPAWRGVVRAFLAWDGDVIADLGRVGGAETPVAVLEAADVVVMVLRPTLAQVDAARPRLDVLRTVVGEGAQIGLCIVDDGVYTAAEVERVLDVPVFTELAYSVPEARVLSDGTAPRLTFKTSLLMRDLETLGRRVRQAAAEVADQVEQARSALTAGSGR
ncbi:hypothetical protein [Actinomadura sp. SCN-SB]|uniref:hypothetical protein n=1 Tax=Actinomadura sp. SCN-SB TaxID=3373092 RepID=UPI003753D46A